MHVTVRVPNRDFSGQDRGFPAGTGRETGQKKIELNLHAKMRLILLLPTLTFLKV